MKMYLKEIYMTKMFCNDIIPYLDKLVKWRLYAFLPMVALHKVSRLTQKHVIFKDIYNF